MADIVFRAVDRVSGTVSTVSNSIKHLDKDMEEAARLAKEYAKRQQDLSSKLAEAQRKLVDAAKGVKDAKKAYAELNDETNRTNLERAFEEYNKVAEGVRNLKQEARETQRAIRDLDEQSRQSSNRSGGSIGGSVGGTNGGSVGGDLSGTLSTLSKAGLTKMLGDSISGAANTLISSGMGSETGTMVSSTLSGVASGAALGSIVPGIGTAVGAAVGGIAGAISGATQVYEERDEAFKAYVQDSAEAQIAQRDSDIQAGSTVAAGREQKQLAFSTLLGSDQRASDFLSDVKAMAADTNYTYDEITNYAKSLVKPFGADKSLDILTTLSDASAALSLNESDNSVLIAGLSRMKLTDKTTQEYLNYFSERGIDVYAALSKWGDAAEVTSKVSKGEIKGSEAVEEILNYMREQYGGLSVKMAETYEGMMGNLEDAEANAAEAYGRGYNEARKEGIQAQTEWLSSGAMDEANQAIGAWQAQLENEKERFVREAVEETMTQDPEYLAAKAAGDAAEMGRLIMAAKVRGQNEYNATEGAQQALEAELALAATIRDNTASDDAYWAAGYRKGEAYSKGWDAAIFAIEAEQFGGIETAPFDEHARLNQQMVEQAQAGVDPSLIPQYDMSGVNQYDEHLTRYAYGGTYPGAPPGYAYGLNRVPYDNYPAMLHEDERVLTASQARQADQGGGAARTVNIYVTIDGHGMGTDELATAVARELATVLPAAIETSTA